MPIIFAETKKRFPLSVLLTVYLASLSMLFSGCGPVGDISLCFPYFPALYLTALGLIVWPITFLIADVLIYLLRKLQLKVLPNHGIVFSLMSVVLFLVIHVLIQLYQTPYNIVHVIPLSQVCMFTHDSDAKDECLGELSATVQSTAACDMIGSGISRTVCYEELAVASGDYAVCDAMSKDRILAQSVDSCKKRVRYVKSDYPTEQCDSLKIADPQQAARCYYDLAFQYQERDFCLKAYAINHDVGASCWLDEAKKWRDEVGCDMLKSRDKQKAIECYELLVQMYDGIAVKQYWCDKIKPIDEVSWQKCYTDFVKTN